MLRLHHVHGSVIVQKTVLCRVLDIRTGMRKTWVTWAGAVLASSSWLARLCFCCMVRQKICCMPLDTTDTAAIAVPKTLFSISRSVMVLHHIASPLSHPDIASLTHYPV